MLSSIGSRNLRLPRTPQGIELGTPRLAASEELFLARQSVFQTCIDVTDSTPEFGHVKPAGALKFDEFVRHVERGHDRQLFPRGAGLAGQFAQARVEQGGGLEQAVALVRGAGDAILLAAQTDLDRVVGHVSSLPRSAACRAGTRGAR